MSAYEKYRGAPITPLVAGKRLQDNKEGNTYQQLKRISFNHSPDIFHVSVICKLLHSIHLCRTICKIPVTLDLLVSIPPSSEKNRELLQPVKLYVPLHGIYLNKEEIQKSISTSQLYRE